MKRKLQLTIVLIALISGSAFAQFAYFPFDEDAIDANEEINSSAEASGISFVQDGERGPVMALDGTNGFITYPGNDIYDFDALTYNIWFKWTTGVANQWWARIFDYGLPSDMPDHPGNHDVVFLTLYQEGLLAWHIHSVEWTDGYDTILWSVEPIARNEWYMLTCTHNADSAKLYLNGELQDARSVNGKAPSDFEFLNMYLAKSNWPDPLFTGRLDEFTIWNEVLSAEDIAELYVFPEVPDATESFESNHDKIYAHGNSLVVAVEEPRSGISLSVYNLLGAEIMRKKGFGSHLEVNMLQRGLYIVKLSNGSRITLKKIFIR